MMTLLKWYLESLSPHQLKNMSKLDPSDKAFWIRAWLHRQSATWRFVFMHIMNMNEIVAQQTATKQRFLGIIVV